MSKRTTIVIDSFSSLRTSDLKHWDTISNQWIAGKNNSLCHLRVTYELTREGLFLGYTYNESRLDQFIEIQIEPSNLGFGEVWYFLCPVSGRKCRKLVLWKGKFVHQSCIENHFYKQQTESTPERNSFNWIRKYKKHLELEKKQREKHYKPTYAGKHTKLDVRAMQALLRYASALSNENKVNAWFKHKPGDQQ